MRTTTGTFPTPWCPPVCRADRVRPRLVSDDLLLDAALGAFAETGCEGASVRALCRRLEVSHNLLNTRYGSKERL